MAVMTATDRPDSHGRELRSCDLGGIRVSEVAMPPGLELRRHAHPAGQIVFVLEGSYRERWRQGWRHLAPGSVLYRPPGVEHANRFGSDEVLALLVAYRPGRLQALGAPRGPRELGPLLGDLRARIECEWQRDDPASRAALEGLALLLLARSLRPCRDAERPEWLRHALDLVRRRYAVGVTLSSLAEEVGLHRATVAAGFRRHLGRSVGEVIRDVRLAHALDEIRDGRRPLADIAVECGYYDQSHMGRCVKRATGTTPAQIRDGG